jgi:hypothetical protein
MSIITSVDVKLSFLFLEKEDGTSIDTVLDSDSFEALSVEFLCPSTPSALT